MSGPGSGLKIVQADPLPFVECPRCGFPLNTHYEKQFLDDVQRTVVYVACSCCMWAERWGNLKIHQEEIEDGPRKAATG
jgi:hypothetical protein